jgi:hypothetical protein
MLLRVKKINNNNSVLSCNSHDSSKQYLDATSAQTVRQELHEIIFRGQAA